MCLCVHVAVFAQGIFCRTGGKRVSLSQWCDSVRDCPDGEDEAQCSKRVKSTHKIRPCGFFLWYMNNLNVCLCLSPSASPRDWIPSPELLSGKPDVDAGVRWKLDPPPFQSCLWTTGIQEVWDPIVCYCQMKSLFDGWADVDLVVSSGCHTLPSVENQQMATCTYKMLHACSFTTEFSYFFFFILDTVASINQGFWMNESFKSL